MVGKIAGVTGGSFAAVIGRLVGRPYALGEMGRGLDCFSSIYAYLGEAGQELPDEYQGLTLQTYADLFREDPGRAKEIMCEFMGSVADEIEPGLARVGDVLLLKCRTKPEAGPALGIHGGGGNVVTSSREHGVTVYKLKNYTIERAWRCRRQSR